MQQDAGLVILVSHVCRCAVIQAKWCSGTHPDAVWTRTEDPRDYRVSFTRINKTLGFEVSRTLDDGIREVARLVRDGVVGDASHPSYRN